MSCVVVATLLAERVRCAPYRGSLGTLFDVAMLLTRVNGSVTLVVAVLFVVFSRLDA